MIHVGDTVRVQEELCPRHDPNYALNDGRTTRRSQYSCYCEASQVHRIFRDGMLGLLDSDRNWMMLFERSELQGRH